MTNDLNDPASLSPQARTKARLAGVIGNVVEWYDFALYGYLAVTIGQVFFPDSDPTASLLASYGVFAAGFLMRPLGAAFFGWMGDTVGRGATMLLSVAMMAFPTIALGLLPGYATLGLWAPVLLVIIRMLQGLSVGGEFSSSVTYMVETADQKKRGQAGSWANVGSMVGMLLGSGAAATVNTVFTPETLADWGWRIPFLLGGVLGSVAILLRRKLPKSPHFVAHEKNTPSRSPLMIAWSENRREMAQAFVFAASYGVVFYLVMVYLPTWLSRQAGNNEATALQINSVLTAAIIPLMVFFAWIGDRFIRRTRLIALSMAAIAIAAVPLAQFMLVGGWAAMLTGQAVMILLIAVPLGSAPAVFVELFPSKDRLTAYSISFNLGTGLIGGMTPMVAIWLIEVTGASISPAWLLTAAATSAALALLWMRDRSREALL